MKNVIYTLSVIVVVLIMTSCKENKRAKNYNRLIDDGSVLFIQQGLEEAQTEIAAAKIAQSVSKDARILIFAKSAVLDHLTSNEGLEQIAINNKVRGGDSISVTHQKTIDSLGTLAGTAFNKAYIQFMVTNHQAAVKSYKIASTDKIEEIQQFARKTLPLLRTHLDSANSILADLK
ncbi:DUF4142 domain-containing protein [Mucilaginibacter antarcticus]|uniref:DUF4142 domain-containing protein n=1 Tax=Mucilaginibacter antarcticus TaxID=1855725 RepID=A0ABW5XR27_9SPHI